MLAGDAQVQRRKVAVEQLLRVICDEDEFPWFVSDEATAFDVCTSSEEELMARVSAAYGIAVPAADLKLPIWQLAERLSRKANGRDRGGG